MKLRNVWKKAKVKIKKKLFNEVSVLKRTNTDLFSQLTNQNKQLVALRKSQNDMEQHGRMWNLRIFNVAEPPRTDEPESTAACTKKVCNICTELVGVTVREGVMEIAHRVGQQIPGNTNPRPVIIVRFHSRTQERRGRSCRNAAS
ncbi:hypothetical protein ACOMHN_056056 [Nucella lapillus]